MPMTRQPAHLVPIAKGSRVNQLRELTIDLLRSKGPLTPGDVALALPVDIGATSKDPKKTRRRTAQQTLDALLDEGIVARAAGNYRLAS